MNNNNNSRTKAFGFINMLVTVAIVAIIGSIAYVAMTGVKDTAEEQLLNDQVATLNKSVKLYLSSGGSIDGLSTAQAVIDKMKTISSNGEKMAGFRGNFIDPRLEAVEQSDQEAATSGELRVIWDEVAQNFKIATGGDKGIKEFKIDATVTPASIQTEDRETQFELAATSETGSWVWDFDRETAVSASPIITTASHDTDLDIDPTDSNYTKTQLAQPIISPAPTGTAAPLADFGDSGMPVVISNPNDEEHSELYVSVDGGYWDPLTDGGTVNVPPGGNLATFAHVKEASEALYYSSYVRAGRFEATTSQLPAPSISTSASAFHPIDEETISVTVTDPNTPAAGEPRRGFVEVKMGAEGTWQTYNGPFDLDIDSHSTGVTIYAKSSPTQWGNYYLENEATPAALGADIVTLQTPQIVMSETSFNPVDRPILTFTVLDNNPSGTTYASLSYSVDNGDTWEDYTSEVTIDLLDHLTGTTILARSEPTIHIANFEMSPEDNQAVSVEDATLNTPSIASQYPVLNPQGYPSSTITLSNANSSSISSMEYSTDDGATWTAYADPFTVSYDDFPAGCTILAKAVPTIIPEHLFESANATKTLPIPPKLQQPGFELTPDGYVKSIYNAGFGIDDDNNAGDSILSYRVDGGEWTTYDAAAGVVLTSWPVVLEAKATATDYLNHRDSDTSSGNYTRIWLTPNLAFNVSSSGIPSSVHTFTGASSGVFSNGVAESSSSYVYADGSFFSWGTGTSSWLSYDGTGWAGMQAGEMFRLGTLDYFNGTIDSDSGASAVTLELTVELELPDATEIFDISMALDNTTNTNDVDESADYVTIGNLVNDFTTQIDGIDYSLNLAFGYYGSSGFTTVDAFHVHEGAVATADMWGYFSSDQF